MARPQSPAPAASPAPSGSAPAAPAAGSAPDAAALEGSSPTGRVPAQDAAAPARGRGRPPAAPAAQEAQRQRLLDATAAVFARTGYHGLAVELVVAGAGLSRPTFYKHFRNTDEAIECVIAELNDRLIAALLAAVDGQASPFAALEAALVAWRDWGHDLGPLLRPLFAELHDAHSPASRHRLRTLAVLADRLRALMQEAGFPPPPRLQVDAFLNGMEFLGYRFHLQTPRDDASWQETRDGMLRLALGLLGNAQVWESAADLARALDIDLDRVAGSGDARTPGDSTATPSPAVTPASSPAAAAAGPAPELSTAPAPLPARQPASPGESS